MADTNLQRTSSAVWWILGIIALAVVLWFLFARGAAERGTTQFPPLGEPVALAAPSLANDA